MRYFQVLLLTLVFFLQHSALALENTTFEPETRYCPVCPIAENWPIDVDGDSIAEQATLRTCSDVGLSNLPIQTITMTNWRGEILFYTTNLVHTDEIKEQHSSLTWSVDRISSYDFSNDSKEELVLNLNSQERNDLPISILGYIEGRVRELHLNDYREILPDDSFKATENLYIHRKAYLTQDGFKLFASTAENNDEGYLIYYLQDNLDREFYPVKILPASQNNQIDNTTTNSEIITYDTYDTPQIDDGHIQSG